MESRYSFLARKAFILALFAGDDVDPLTNTKRMPINTDNQRVAGGVIRC